MRFHDHFSGHAAAYAQHRPRYPAALFAHLAAVAPGRALAWDCGTGSGQAAVALAAHFARVVATDASARQIAQAEAAPRVAYAVALTERAPLPGASVDLVVAAQAMHWFDLAAFFAEVKRVARRNAVLAAWCYDLMHVDRAVDAAVARLYGDVAGSFWPPERVHVESGYRDLPFPFPPLPAPAFAMEHSWTLQQLVDYMETWSAVRRFTEARGHSPLREIEEELRRAWGDPAVRRVVRWPLALRLGRIA